MLRNAAIFPTIPVKDLARARKFYEDKLGLTPREEMDAGIIYACGNGSVFFLYKSGGAGTNQATYAGWDVENLESEMAELRDKGVEFEEYDMPGLKTVNGIATTGDERGAWFKDTEGNILSINQRLGDKI